MDCLVASLYTAPGDGAKEMPCPICTKNWVPVHRFYKFRTLPEVLLLSINRTLGLYLKNKARCVVPETLDLSAYLEDEEGTRGQNASYQLVGAVLHSGSDVDAGHYIVHVRNKAGYYFRLDDKASNRVSSSSIDYLNNDCGFDVVMVAYIKVHKSNCNLRGASMLEMIESHIRDRTSDRTKGSERALGRSYATGFTDQPPTKGSPAKHIHPKIPPPDKPLPEPSWPREVSVTHHPRSDTPKQNPPPRRDRPCRPDHGKMEVRSNRDELRKVGLKLDSKKQPLEWYLDKLIRHDAQATTYDEYTVEELINGEMVRRNLHTRGITVKAAAIRELERDDREKGYTRPSVRSINCKARAEGKPRNSAVEGGKARKDKPGRLSKGKLRIHSRKKQLTKKSEDSDSPGSERCWNNERNATDEGEKGFKNDAEGLLIKGHDMDPPLPPMTDSQSFTMSMTLQILGKGSGVEAALLTQTWPLAAPFDPLCDLNVIGQLTIAMLDGQTNHVSTSISSEKHQFHLDSLLSAKKKRKLAPMLGPHDAQLPTSKKPKCKRPLESDPVDSNQKPARTPIRKLRMSNNVAQKKNARQPAISPARDTPNDSPAAQLTSGPTFTDLECTDALHVASSSLVAIAPSLPSALPLATSDRRTRKSTNDKSACGINHSSEAADTNMRNIPPLVKPVPQKKPTQPRSKPLEEAQFVRPDLGRQSQKGSKSKGRRL